MNAGIGGWTIRAFMNDARGRNVDTALSQLKPDVMFLEYSANDDWFYFQRKTRGKPQMVNDAVLADRALLELYSLKQHRIESCSGQILELTPGSLRASGMHDVEVGDIARIGTEIREITVAENGRIHWHPPLRETTAREVSIRSMTEYENDFRQLIQRIRARFPDVILFLTAPAPANYDRRQLWGYEIALNRLAGEHANYHMIDMKTYFASFRPEDWLEYEFTADGGTEYELPWTGYSQYFELTPQAEFTVRCTDRFELAFYHEFSLSNPSESDPRKECWRMNGPVPMRLVFRTPPPAGIRFKLRYSPGGWSHDYCHPNPAGCRVYTDAYYAELQNVLGD